MATISRPSDILLRAQALDAWAACRERVSAELEREAVRVAGTPQAHHAAHLKAAAACLRRNAIRERAQAALLRQSVRRHPAEPDRPDRRLSGRS